MSEAIHFKSAVELAAMVRAKEIGCVELLEHFLARVSQTNDITNISSATLRSGTFAQLLNKFKNKATILELLALKVSTACIRRHSQEIHTLSFPIEERLNRIGLSLARQRFNA